MTKQEIRAKALEAADAAIIGGRAATGQFWVLVTLFEVYITTGVQPDGKKAT